MNLNYIPQVGQKSLKAQELVEFCLGEFPSQSVKTCSEDETYFQSDFVGHISTKGGILDLRAAKTTESRALKTCASRSRIDERCMFRALVAQNAKIPDNLSAWVFLRDSVGRGADLNQGLHFTGSRSTKLRSLVILPIGDRDRYHGPELRAYRKRLKNEWCDWDQKNDRTWWGGALTGKNWGRNAPELFTRQKLVEGYLNAPSETLYLHPTEDPSHLLPKGLSLKPNFKKSDAFKISALRSCPVMTPLAVLLGILPGTALC